MIVYEKVVDGIRYERIVTSKDTDIIKELVTQGWEKVEPSTAKETKAPTGENAPAPKAK